MSRNGLPRRRGFVGGAVALAVLGTLGGCRSYARREPLIAGTIVYGGPIGLRPEDEIVVRIVEAGGVQAAPIAEQRIHTDRQVPIPYSLAYDTEVLKGGAPYVIEAQIWRAGRILFRTPRPIPVDPSRAVTDLTLALEQVPG